jgi:hypothetical protein
MSTIIKHLKYKVHLSFSFIHVYLISSSAATDLAAFHWRLVMEGREGKPCRLLFLLYLSSFSHRRAFQRHPPVLRGRLQTVLVMQRPKYSILHTVYFLCFIILNGHIISTKLHHCFMLCTR